MSDETITMSDGDWRITIDDDGLCEITDADDRSTHKSNCHQSTALHLAMALGTIRKLQRNQRPETTGELIERLGWIRTVPEHDPVEGLL